jgi:hypothetical protein
MRTLTIFFLFLVLLTSCESDYKPYTSPPDVVGNTTVISDPPGARIELDNEYLGTTPLQIEWDVYHISGKRRLSHSHVLCALPTQAGHYVQTKRFDYADIAPKTIFFDMRLGPVLRPPLEVDILD